VRFTVLTHGVGEVKDAMSRYIISEFKVGVGIASATCDIVGLPAIEIPRQRTPGSWLTRPFRRPAASGRRPGGRTEIAFEPGSSSRGADTCTCQRVLLSCPRL
jgi:hypothetical protein